MKKIAEVQNKKTMKSNKIFEKIKKHKKRIFMFLILCILIYIIYMVVQLIKKPTDTVYVEMGKIQEEESANGYVIRDEVVLKGNNYKNGIEQIKTEGEKVAKGEAIFRYYSNDEKNLVNKIKELDAKLKNDKLDFISALESGYEIREYQFPTFNAKSGNGLRKESLGYLKIEQECDRIAAFVFSSLPDIGELNSMTLNLNGMVSRRFEGYEEYLKIREFDIKTGDLITVEVEFDSSEPFTLDGLLILLLKKKS